MILKIAKEKVQFVAPILNGEKVIVEIEEISTKIEHRVVNEIEIDVTVMILKTGMYGETNYNSNHKQRGNILGISNNFKFDLAIGENPYSTIGIRKIKESLKTSFNLVDTDIEIMANIAWQEDIILYPIRITIPTDVIVSVYKDLIGSQDNNPRYKIIDSYILYVHEILPKHEFIKNDINLLIEE